MPAPRRRWPAALLALALPLEACGGATTPMRVRVPIARNPEGSLTAERCVLDCRGRFVTSSSKYAECLSTCPGAKIDEDAQCSIEDRTPKAACVEWNRDLRAEDDDEDGDEPKKSSKKDQSAAFGLVSFLLDVAASVASKSGGASRRKLHRLARRAAWASCKRSSLAW
jgi:hypothetical protein